MTRITWMEAHENEEDRLCGTGQHIFRSEARPSKRRAKDQFVNFLETHLHVLVHIRDFTVEPCLLPLLAPARYTIPYLRPTFQR